MEKFNRISLPVAILIASVILGGFYFVSQINKQKSIERQQQMEIEQETKKEEEARLNNLYLENCLAEAKRIMNEGQIAVNKFINDGNLDGVSNPEVVFNLPSEEFEKDKKECFLKYPQ